MQPEDVVHVLNRMIEAVRHDGLILDLQVIRPNPRIELTGQLVGEIDGEPLFRWADAATAAVDAHRSMRTYGWVTLLKEAVDDHDVLTHYADEATFAEAWEQGRTLTIDEAVALTLDSLD